MNRSSCGASYRSLAPRQSAPAILACWNSRKRHATCQLQSSHIIPSTSQNNNSSVPRPRGRGWCRDMLRRSPRRASFVDEHLQLLPLPEPAPGIRRRPPAGNDLRSALGNCADSAFLDFLQVISLAGVDVSRSWLFTRRFRAKVSVGLDEGQLHNTEAVRLTLSMHLTWIAELHRPMYAILCARASCGDCLRDA